MPTETPTNTFAPIDKHPQRSRFADYRGLYALALVAGIVLVDGQVVLAVALTCLAAVWLGSVMLRRATVDTLNSTIDLVNVQRKAIADYRAAFWRLAKRLHDDNLAAKHVMQVHRDHAVRQTIDEVNEALASQGVYARIDVQHDRGEAN